MCYLIAGNAMMPCNVRIKLLKIQMGAMKTEKNIKPKKSAIGGEGTV